ncbi:MAG TPA: hypothetical protein VFC68_01240 [Treponemataceae bacterium]|nr:hypothetical protein [Treponemataceae bacterium]
MEIRQNIFYDILVEASNDNENWWLSKHRIAKKANAIWFAMKALTLQGDKYEPLYVINTSETAHDVCSLMNHDRIAINASLDYEKIILVKDNKFKVATLEETLAEEEKIRKQALKQLWRGSLIKAKRLNDKQIIIDFETEVEKVIETFGGKYE